MGHFEARLGRIAERSVGEGDVYLVEARHPLLEIQEDINFIPNDVDMKRGAYISRHHCTVGVW